jgi:uroporphyrinogen decarboxylase
METMMAKISERENFYRMVRGEQPDFVSHQPGLIRLIVPSAMRDKPPGHKAGIDWFGVTWVPDPDNPALLAVDTTKPYVLGDIANWRDIITWPDLEAIDWPACATHDLGERDPNKIVVAMLTSGPFERLHDLMGFEEALVATITEPDECEAFFAALCDFKIKLITKLKQHYNIDCVHFHDDWGTQRDLFFRPEFWRDRIKPHIQRVIDASHALDVLFIMHSCGKIDLIVDEIVAMGIDVIDPAQPVNDLAGWHQRFGGKVIIMGGLDAQGIIDNPAATDEQIRQETRQKIDLLATGGYFIPFAVSLSPRARIALNECFIYGRTFYNQDYQDEVTAFKEAIAKEQGQEQELKFSESI